MAAGSQNGVEKAENGFLARYETPIVIASMLFLTLLYASLALNFSHLRAFWSPDMGARWAMIRNWNEHDNLIYLHYDTAADPDGSLNPLGLLGPDNASRGYVVHLRKGFCTVYPPLFPFLSGLLSRRFGFGALTLLPVVSGLGALLLLYATACRLQLRCRALLPIIAGLTTPLLLYAIVFWDHSLHVFLSALAAYLLLRTTQENRMRYAVGAGASLGFGLFFHELFFPLFFALIIAGLFHFRRETIRRALAGLVAGFLPLTAIWAATNQALYGSALGVHVATSSNYARSAEFAGMYGPREVGLRVLNELFGQVGWASSVAVFLALSLAASAWARWGRPARWMCGLLWMGAAAVAFAWLKNVSFVGAPGHPNCAYGLLETTPLLVLALLPPGKAARSASESGAEANAVYTRWIGLAALVFTLFVCAYPQAPGMWGNRFLLTALPFYLLPALAAAETAFRTAPGRLRLAPLVGAIALIAVGLYASFRGLDYTRARLLNFRDSLTRVTEAPTPVIVTNVWFYGAEFVDTPPQRLFLVLNAKTDGPKFFNALDRLGINQFTYFGVSNGLLALTRIARAQTTPFYPIENIPGIGIRFARTQAGVAPDQVPMDAASRSLLHAATGE